MIGGVATENYTEFTYMGGLIAYLIPLTGSRYYIVACIDDAFEFLMSFDHDLESAIKDMEPKWPIHASFVRNGSAERTDKPFLSRFRDFDDSKMKWFIGIVHAYSGSQEEFRHKLLNDAVDLLELVQSADVEVRANGPIGTANRNWNIFTKIAKSFVKCSFEEHAKKVLGIS